MTRPSISGGAIIIIGPKKKVFHQLILNGHVLQESMVTPHIVRYMAPYECWVMEVQILGDKVTLCSKLEKKP